LGLIVIADAETLRQVIIRVHLLTRAPS